MTDQSDTKQNDVSRLETGLQQGKNIWEKIKKREIQPELRNLINRSRTEIHRRSIQLQKFSYKRFFQRRRNGISLSFNLAKRNVIRSRYRSVLLILGIILTIALETGIVISVDTLYDDFLLDNRNQNFTDITVHPTTWHDIEGLRTVTSTIKKISGVAKSSPVYYASVDRFLGNPISSNILVYGIEPSTHPDFSNINLTAGRRVIDNNTIIVSERIYDQADVQIDQNINLGELGDDFESLDVTVGGVMNNEPFFGNKIGYSFILVDIDTFYDIIPDNRKSEILSSEIDIEVTNLMNIQRTSEKIKDVVGVSYFVFTEKDISGIEASGISAYQTAMNLVILASFVVEFLFIANILAISIRDRSKEFGILRAVGTGSYQLIESVAVEILIYSIIGGTIGLAIGIGFSNVLVEIMDTFYTSIQFQGLSLNFSSLAATFLSGILVALIAGLYPIFIAISIPVVQNLHSKMGGGSSKGTISQSWKYTIITGFLLAFVGFILQFFVGPSRFLDFEILSFHFLTVLLIFIGTLILEIGILVFLPKIAMRMLIGFNIVTRTISTRNIAREFQKSLFTILTSGLALTFIIVVGLVSAAVIAGAPDYFQSQWGNIDLVAETSDLNPLSLTYTENLELDYRITGSSFIQESRTEISGIDGYVYGVDPTKYADFAETVVDSIDSGIPSDIYLNPLNPNTTNGLISHLLYQKLNIPLGSNVSIKIAVNSTVNVTLTCVIKGNLFLGGGEYLYISTNRFQELYNTTNARWFICDVEGSVRNVENSLENRNIFRDVIPITYFAEMMERSLLFQSAIFQLLFVESFILAAIAQFICILVSTLRMEREIGIMRSLGLTRRGVFGIFLTESVALGISAIIVGLIDGLLGSVLLAEYISNSIPISINFPVMTIATWIFLSFSITIFSTIIPSYRSSRKNIVATISGRPMTRDHFEFSPYRLRDIDRTSYRSGISHSPSHGSIINSRFQIDNRRRWSNESSQAVIENQIGSTSIYGYIRRNAFQIQTVFLILMAAITLNYIFDEKIIMQGLTPFDVFIRLLMPFNDSNIGVNYFDTFLIFNPFLAIIGLAGIIPISHYLSNQQFSISSLRKFIQSLFWGIIGLIILYLTIIPFMTIFLEFLVSLLLAASNNPEVFTSSSTFMFFNTLYLIFVYFVSLYLYSMFWSFLIITGVRDDIGFSDQFRILRRINSRGIIGFSVWLLVHFFLQLILYITLFPVPSLFGDLFVPPHDLMVGISLGPIEFLVLAIFEVGFFLFLIIYQLVQLEKCQVAFPPINVQKQEEIEPRITNIEIISRAQTAADEILVKNVEGIKIKHNGQLVFSESINDTSLLFYQENPSSNPVAMNYSRYYPLEQKEISPTDQLSINIPSTSQMQQFLELSSELKLIPG